MIVNEDEHGAVHCSAIETLCYNHYGKQKTTLFFILKRMNQETHFSLDLLQTSMFLVDTQLFLMPCLLSTFLCKIWCYGCITANKRLPN